MFTSTFSDIYCNISDILYDREGTHVGVPLCLLVFVSCYYSIKSFILISQKELDMATAPYRWHRQTIAETFERICGRNSTTPWVAIGDFLDDWKRSAVEHRLELVVEPIAPAPTPEIQRWAAFCAAMVEWLCWQDGLSFPEWTKQESYRLKQLWFLYKGWRLRAWQLATTPTPFRMRNIFGGDRMLDRV
jgi:hypothetical protein